MTDKIIELMREAGFQGEYPQAYTAMLKRFAQLVIDDHSAQCNPHPQAPHGFDRNSSHTLDRYVCECESWDPYEAGYDAGYRAALERISDDD